MNPNQPLNELALFAGAGGGILGGKLLGWRTICAVEWDAYARDVLVARQNDGCLDPFPIWDDVQTFDGTPWRGSVDVVSGGFPCQDISAAGKGAGIEGERSGMWKHMARIIGEVLPRFVLVENSPLLVGRGLGVVLGDIAAMGYDARWGIVGAHHAAAPHKRDRIWIVANASGVHDRSGNAGTSQRQESEPRKSRGASHVANARRKRYELANKTLRSGRDSAQFGGKVGDAASERLPHGINRPMGQSRTITESERPDWWTTEPDVGRVAHGVAARVDRLRCLGNGQVPAVVPLAWNLLTAEP
jgi:DNA (cytosine-5)-methyltransferase 1